MADPVHIQNALGATPDGIATGSIALAYSAANLTVGSVLVCYTTWGGLDNTPSCADGTPQTWTAGPKLWDSTNSQGGAIFYFKNNASTVKPTVTITYSIGNATFRGIQIAEIGPADTTTQPDAAGPAWRLQASPATTTDLVASNSITVATANSLLWGASLDIQGVAQPAAGTGFAARGGYTTSVPTRMEDKTVSSGSTTATFTAGATGTRSMTGVMAFRTSGPAPAAEVPDSIFPKFLLREPVPPQGRIA